MATILYIASLAMAGKCSGKWAIHACGGGNGKRSEGADYNTLASDEFAAAQRDLEKDDRSRSLLARLTRLSARDHGLPQPAAETGLLRDDLEISESEERPLWNAEEILAEIGRDNRNNRDDVRRVDDIEESQQRDEDRAELLAALRLIKRLQASSSKSKLNDVIDDSP
jgi:hypothetical protein